MRSAGAGDAAGGVLEEDAFDDRAENLALELVVKLRAGVFGLLALVAALVVLASGSTLSQAETPSSSSEADFAHASR